MSNTLKFGTDGNWATKEGSTLAYNDENGNFKPLPFTFERSTGATRVNKQGLIEVVSNNEPRIDFKNDSNGALLLEPSRSNAITYSEDFTLGGWTSANVTITSNYGTSPDGNLNSTKLIFGSGTAYLNRASGVGVGDQSSSIYVKGINGQILKFGKGNNVGGGDNFTLNGEWQRLVHISTDSGTAFHITSNLDGANATEIEIYGAQLEAGSYATSYIPTQGSAVTRVADVCNNGGNEQVINSTEGVLYADVNFKTFIGQDYFGLNDGTNTQRVLIEKNDTNINCYVGSATLNGTISSLSNKIAIKWKLNDFKMYINGVEVSNITNGTVPVGLDRLDFQIGGGLGLLAIADFKDVRVYNEALTDAELIALTSN